MKIMKKFKQIRDNYVIRQVASIKIPVFQVSEVVRERVLFQGRVQKVGFRLEVLLLAKRLGLTGVVKNQEDGTVLMEAQGEQDKIEFLIDFMGSLRRIKIHEVERTKLPLCEGETSFHR